MKGAIFDMDGTLLDSMTVWVDITDQFLSKRGIYQTDEVISTVQEMTLEESSIYLKERFSLAESPESVVHELKEMANHEYAHHIPLKPYAKEYLYRLKQGGIKLAVATSGFLPLCQSALKRHGVLEWFDGFALSSEVGVNKGNPDIYLLAAERIGVNPSDCVVYEDILLGISGAKKAGMRVVAVEDETNRHMACRLREEANRYITGWHELL